MVTEGIDLERYIRSIPDWPKKGILFRDITPLLADPKAFAAAVDAFLCAGFMEAGIEYVAAVEARGFIFGAAVAKKLGVGFVPIRKKDKLPFETESVSGGDTVIIDGNRGIVIVNPDDETIQQYEEYSLEFVELEHKLDAIRRKPAATRDGVKITLLGNIEFPDEAELVLQKGGEGIGLYRTEFLYLNRESEPTEQDHYQAYAETVAVFKHRPVIIRTVDLGADKYTQSKRFAPEPNPFLGLRSTRFCPKLSDVILPPGAHFFAGCVLPVRDVCGSL